VLLRSTQPFWLQQGRAELCQPSPEGSLSGERCDGTSAHERDHVTGN